jgi:hypothetical protein
MKRAAAILLASLTLSACGGLVPDHVADPAQITAAQNRFDGCLRAQVRKLDDRKIDATFLAEEAMGYCSTEWHAVVDAQSAGMSITGSLQMEDNAAADERTMAIAVVVEERKAHPN